MRPPALLVALLAVVVPGANPAEACGNAVIFATDANVRAVKTAEDKLNDGSPAEAATTILALKLKLFQSGTSLHANARVRDAGLMLANRAMRIVTLAAVRTDGAVGPFGNADSLQRGKNVQWAVDFLDELAWTKPDDAASMTDYAEALAKTNAPAAKNKLEELAAKDVLATPYAYAALAGLRAIEGDASGRDEALARCMKMAAKASICQLPAPGTR